MRRGLGALAIVLLAAVVGLVLGGALGGGDDSGGGRAQSGGLDALRSAAPAAGGAGARFDLGAATADPGRGVAIVAQGRAAAVAIFRSPASGERPLRRVQRRTVDGKRLPVVFSVEQQRRGWLKVELPVRPNKGSGWVRARDVRLARTPYRIEIRLRDHRLVLFEHDRVVAREQIAVGRAISPTPTGRYFVADLLRPPDPDGFYGPYALGLSAYSPVYTSFAGGDGQVGIHGTNMPSVLGSDVSHGCIRVSNATVTRLAETVPLGTPVIVRA